MRIYDIVIIVTGLIVKMFGGKRDFMFSINLRVCVYSTGGSEMPAQNIQFITQDNQKYQLPCHHVSDSQEIYE